MTTRWSRRWPEQLDFAGPRRRTAWWSWALLGLVVAAGLALEHRVSTLEEARGEAAAELKRLQRADQRQRLAGALQTLTEAAGNARAPHPALLGTGVALPPLQGTAMQEAARLARRLAYPWAAVLQGLETESARQQVVLMGMSLDMSSPQVPVLRAQGAVQDDLAALRWAAGLPQGQLLGRQVLTSPFEATQGRYGLRAEVQAVWHGALAGRP